MIDTATFSEIARNDVKGQTTEEEAAWLRSEENISDFRDAVTELMRDIDAQLGERAAALQRYRNECWKLGDEGKQLWFDGLAQYETWRASAKRVKINCQNTAAEIKRIQAQRRETAQEERREARTTLPRPETNKKLRQELHLLRTALAAISEEYDIENFEVEDWRLEESDASFARLERNSDDTGWQVVIEQSGGTGGVPV